MKKITAILTLLICGLVFGCEGEDVVGFKVGCKIEITKDFEKLPKMEGYLSNVYDVKGIKFFDFARLQLDSEGRLAVISFMKTYNISMDNLKSKRKDIFFDFKSILESLEKRWGGFDKSDIARFLNSKGDTNFFYMGEIYEKTVNKNPKSNNIGLIGLTLLSHGGENIISGDKEVTLILIYIEKDRLKEMSAEDDKKTEGF